MDIENIEEYEEYIEQLEQQEEIEERIEEIEEKIKEKKEKKKEKQQIKGFKQEYNGISWSPSQQKAIDIIYSGKNVFLTGCGGAGKSLLLKYVIDGLREQGKEVRVTASSGIASVPLSGTTVHAFLGVGLAEGPIRDSIQSIRRRKDILRRIINTQVLIIDEISMLSPVFFHKVNKIIAHIRNNPQLPFGGIQVILVGDYCQLPPIDRGRPRDYQPSINDNKLEFCFELPLWRELKLETIELTDVFRQKDNRLISTLSRIRFAQHTKEDINFLYTRVGISLSDSDGIKPTKLFSRNVNVEETNEQELNLLTGREEIFNYYTNWDIKSGIVLDKETKTLFSNYETKLIEDCQADNTVRLKIGAQVILLANLDFQLGLVNGSRGVVIDFVSAVKSNDCNNTSATGGKKKNIGEKKYPKVKFASGIERVIIENKWQITEQEVGSVCYCQLPLKLAYAISVHRSQGLSLDKAEVSLKGIFDFGQAYVALSRIRSIDSVSLDRFSPTVIKAHPKVVYFYSNAYTPVKEIPVPSELVDGSSTIAPNLEIANALLKPEGSRFKGGKGRGYNKKNNSSTPSLYKNPFEAAAATVNSSNNSSGKNTYGKRNSPTNNGEQKKDSFNAMCALERCAVNNGNSTLETNVPNLGDYLSNNYMKVIGINNYGVAQQQSSPVEDNLHVKKRKIDSEIN